MPQSAFDALASAISTHKPPEVDLWKAENRPVIGYFCRYVPAELLLAAGAYPLRLRAPGSVDTSIANAYLSNRICSYIRNVMGLVLDGQYDFLDGHINLNTCDHVRRAHDVFVKKTGIPFHGFISVPRAIRPTLYPYYMKELNQLREQLAEHFGKTISDDNLREAIRQMNRVREKLAALEERRLADEPKLNGSESLAIYIASQVLMPEAFCELADRLFEEIDAREPLPKPRVRLAIYGAELDSPEYIEVIESQGALVVTDRICFGTRSTLPQVDEDAPDPLDTIAKQLFFEQDCARMIGNFPRRWEMLKKAMREARAEGLIFVRMVFCDPWGAEAHNIADEIKTDTIPLLSLSREHGVLSTGQLRTRVQAFLEKIEISRARNKQNGEDAA